MKIDVRKLDGSKVEKQVDLSKDVFGIAPHEHSVYLAVKTELANSRQGSASTKTRGEVQGSGVKLFRQKGTGRARVGDIRSPIRPGGGVAFGPKPRDYGLKLNRKVKALARRSMLSMMQQKDRIIVVESFELDSHKTKLMVSALDALGLAEKRVMVLASKPSNNLWLAGRNLPGVRIKRAAEVSTYDLWSSDYLLVDRDGVDDLNIALGK